MMDLVVRAPRLPHVGESLLSHSFKTSPGGKGANQAIAAARLGATATMIGRIGQDRFGEILRTGLESAGVDTRFVSVDPAVGTGVAVPIVLDSGENAILAIPQSNLALSPADIEAARETIAAADMLMVQFEVGMEATLAAMGIASDAGVPVMLNPAPIAQHPAEMLRLVSVIVANELEAAALVPEAKSDHTKEIAALQKMAPTAVITLGAEGSLVGRRRRNNNHRGPSTSRQSTLSGPETPFARPSPSRFVKADLRSRRRGLRTPREPSLSPRPAPRPRYPLVPMWRRSLSGTKGTFRGLATLFVDDGDRRTDTCGAPGISQ